jgi:hypothetical protein
MASGTRALPGHGLWPAAARFEFLFFAELTLECTGDGRDSSFLSPRTSAADASAERSVEATEWSWPPGNQVRRIKPIGSAAKSERQDFLTMLASLGRSVL